MPALDGCLAKIERARVHLEEFKAGIRAVEQPPFIVRVVIDAERGECVVRAERNPAASPPPVKLVLIAGEIAHQLRSSLDHLVWQLVIRNTGNPPTGNRSGFPIFSTEEGYDTRAGVMIAGVSADASARVRAAQPFNAGADSEQALTWLVHELNNTDKHRLIPVVASGAFAGGVTLTTMDGQQVDVVPPPLYVEHLEHGTEMARFGMPDRGIATVNAPIGFDLVFAEVGGVRRHPATDLLSKAIGHVETLVRSFLGEFQAA